MKITSKPGKRQFAGIFVLAVMLLAISLFDLFHPLKYFNPVILVILSFGVILLLYQTIIHRYNYVLELNENEIYIRFILKKKILYSDIKESYLKRVICSNNKFQEVINLKLSRGFPISFAIDKLEPNMKTEVIKILQKKANLKINDKIGCI